MMTKVRVVVVGGGTGTYTVLSGLKQFADRLDLSAIVAMTDSGGSTGRLRDEFGYLPVGDVRMALSALAHEDDEHGALIRKLFLHRFLSDGEIRGHNFGNLFLVALTDILGSEDAAIRAASRVLRVCGEVIPVTHEKTHLVAQYADGREIVGEHHIDDALTNTENVRISMLSVAPQVAINPRAIEALQAAQVIIFGPGDLYTSILANCVVPGFKEALSHIDAQLIYVGNLMTKAGQTTGMNSHDHIVELAQYIGRFPHKALLNSTVLPEDLLQRYAAEGEYPVINAVHDAKYQVHTEDLLATEEIVRSPGDTVRRSLIRHDSVKLAEGIFGIIQETQTSI